jgi:hypothetical protein
MVAIARVEERLVRLISKRAEVEESRGERGQKSNFDNT